LLSRRAARKHLVASRLPKYFLRPRSAGSVSPGSGRPVRRELGYGPAVRLKPFRPHLTAGALSCALRSQRAQHAPTARARQAAGAHPGGFPARRPSPAPLEPHLHPVLDLRSSCARRGITPASWLRTPLGVGPTGLPPASNTASPARTTEPSDFPRSSISGVRPQPSPSGPPADQADERAWDLPVLAHGDSAHAQVLRPRGVRRQLAVTLPTMWPSASGDGVGTPEMVISRLNSPACTYPCQRFARALTDAVA
jgi:hypothetical protein